MLDVGIVSENEKDDDVIEISLALAWAREKARSHQRLMGGRFEEAGTAAGFGSDEFDNEEVDI